MDAQEPQPVPEDAQGSDPTFSNLPHDKRWEPLKPIIIQLYMEEGETINRLAARMKEEYNFSAG